VKSPLEIQCSGKASEIYSKLKSKLGEYQAEGKLKQVSDIQFNDASLEAIATGTGFKSLIKCEDGKVSVDLDLNFLLKPMRAQIEEGIRKSIAKAIG
jgi:hypothetical protein